MGIYNMPIDNGSILQAVVANGDDDVVADNLKKLKSSVKNHVVGVDLKQQKYQTGVFIPPKKMLILSSQTFCLLVNFRGDIPKAVKVFMDDRTICFVAMPSLYRMGYKVVDLSNLAARIFKKPSLNECNCLETLAGEVGVERRQPPKLANKEEVANRCGVVFSQEEIEFLIQKAYSIFVVGDKLLGSLGE